MGCTQTKAVAPPENDLKASASTDAAVAGSASVGGSATAPVSTAASNKPATNARRMSNGSHHRVSRRDDPPGTAPRKSSVPSTPERKSASISADGPLVDEQDDDSPVAAASPTTPTTTMDPHWKTLWQTLPPPVDPADVVSVIAHLMGEFCNLLQSTEMLLLQRRIRTLVKGLPKLSQTTSTKMMGRFLKDVSSLQGEACSRTLVEKHHLINHVVLRKLWPLQTPTYNDSSSNQNLDIIGSAVVLLEHFSEQLWDRAAGIAEHAAQHADLEMDVNQQSKKKNKEEHPHDEQNKIPMPPDILEYASEEPLAAEGVSFHSVCFLLALAIRGTRIQRLQLLFYLLLPPQELQEFLNAHPAGGIPTWLLEVDNNITLSLTSMSHYLYFGETFLPTGMAMNDDSGEQEKEEYLRLSSSVAIMETIGTILTTTRSSNNNNKSSDSPERRGHHHHRSRRNGGGADHSDVGSSYIEEDGMDFGDEDESVDLTRFWAASKRHDSDNDWTMDAFCHWANDALEDYVLDVLFHKLFCDFLPSPSAERALVLHRWKQWQQTDVKLWSQAEDHSTTSLLHSSFPRFFPVEDQQRDPSVTPTKVWGGIGGFDGRGGLGHGLMYVVDKKWWDDWEEYVGWNWEARATTSSTRGRVRPSALSTEQLLDHSAEAPVGGTLGSYHLMKVGLVKGMDYVLVPPGVWDVLHELYGGGPPLPRMVLAPPLMETRTRSFSIDSKTMEEEDVISVDASVEVVASRKQRLLRIPEALAVATHPWIFHCHVCDAQQPYRRGDAGPMSIRVMATPDQPLSRLYAEIIVRLPIQNSKAVDKDGRGQARLWRQIEPSGPKDPSWRYGPWGLLCKNRIAILPMANLELELEEHFDELKSDWRAYTDHSTVEGVGLVNGDRIMLEYAVQNKAGVFIWPREAAAKASRMRRLADDELKFRRLLRGVDENDKPISPPPEIEGMTIDAMDLSGRWFQVEILQVQNGSVENGEEHDGDEEPADNGKKSDKSADKKKQIRVDFTEHGGHSEWIDIESDRLATAGRFTLGKDEDDKKDASTTKSGSEAKPKPGAPLKKSNAEAADQSAGKVCTLPGYGACGLANLGNTCYANSAIQCMSYMPMLRAYLLSAQYKATGDLNKDNPLGTGGKLLEEFAELLRVMWSGKYGERSPTRFRGQLGKARTQFSGADQQDAQEFLNYILDVLHEDSNKIKKKPYVEALEDDWVKNNSLPRVGEEAWRRFLRRNRSVMADVAMGQVLNTVTCPVCHFSSRNFDPFNLLSLPFPTVADVVFLITLVRRGSAANSPRVLNRARKGNDKRSRFDRKKLKNDPRGTPENLVIEQYAIAVSRLADIGDLKLRLQNISGISAKRVKLCKLEETVNTEQADDSLPVRNYLKVTALPDKDGPCFHVAKNSGASSSDDVGATSAPTRLVAFELTLRPRPSPSPGDSDRTASEAEDNRANEDDYSTVDEDEDDSSHADARAYSPRDRRLVKAQIRHYGDKKECRIYDTETLAISKAMSRTLWPQTDKEFKLGLRVDAIDHRDHWFPGSVVEIIEGVASQHNGEQKPDATKTKVLVHFDNFSSKWDETYSIDSFIGGQVRPLYSHATPRIKPTEFVVYHRYLDQNTKKTVLFGQSFYIQCENEWSTARAGAHILGQTARFLQRPELSSHGPIDVDEVSDSSMVQRIYDKVQGTVSELIDLLVDCDRVYVTAGLGFEDGRDLLDDTYRNPKFDASDLSNELVTKAGMYLHRLPFEVRVCTAEMPLGGSKEECPFPFSLMRTIGNYMNARHAVVLHWRDPPVDKKYNARAILSSPVMYTSPPVAIHKSSTEILNETKAHASKNNPGSGGMHLSVCLKEFCKTQKLDLSDCWRCPRCKDYREGKQHMDLWRLPDLLTFHIKRFNCSARWREKIQTKVNFPLTGLDMSEWCHSESPATDSNVYDLIGVMNHYGGMTGGHYVAVCKATACGPDGSEEVAYSFPGAGTSVSQVSDDDTDKSVWRLGGIRKEKEMNQNKVAAANAAKYVSESSEPLWLQFDDELVEPIPPRNVVSETAYVLFYRRRQLTPANMAKYSTLE